MFNITFVVSRYNEPLNFLAQEPFYTSKVFVYNKGPEFQDPLPGNNVIVRTLPNVGRCDHTYLYHILQEYDQLDDILCFLPASWNEENLKRFRTHKTIRYLQDTGKACVVVYDKETDRLPIYYDFQLDHYMSGNPRNQTLNPDDTMELSTIRPFGKWYETYIGKEVLLQTDAVQGVFSAHKDQIRKRNRDFYQVLLDQMSHHHNPEVGHYLERSWGSIISANCFLHVDRNTMKDIEAE